MLFWWCLLLCVCFFVFCIVLSKWRYSHVVPLHRHQEQVAEIVHTIQQAKETITRDATHAHVFGLPIKNTKTKITFSDMDRVLSIDKNNMTITVQGGTKVETAMNMLEPLGLTIACPIDLRHLLFAGLVSSVGGGCASFRNGWVHSTMLEADVVTSKGQVITCSRTQNQELFRALPNSLGTLGYLVRMVFRLEQASPYIHVKFIRFETSHEFFAHMKIACQYKQFDYIEGSVLPMNEPLPFVMVCGKKIHKKGNNYMFEDKDIFWKKLYDTSLNDMTMTFNDFMWRHDRDMYYTTQEIPILKSNLVRAMLPKQIMTSTFYRSFAKLCRMEHEAPDTNDIFIPIDQAAKFEQWVREHYQLYPIYICPVQCEQEFTLWKPTKGLMIDFGIGYGCTFRNQGIQKPEHILKKVEEEMVKLHGRKLFYTKIQLSEPEFWAFLDVDPQKYYTLKDKYDPKGKFLVSYDKLIDSS